MTKGRKRDIIYTSRRQLDGCVDGSPVGLGHEESPSTTEQECRLTACEGDFKESATEIYRSGNAVRVEMQGKSLHTCW